MDSSESRSLTYRQLEAWGDGLVFKVLARRVCSVGFQSPVPVKAIPALGGGGRLSKASWPLRLAVSDSTRFDGQPSDEMGERVRENDSPCQLWASTLLSPHEQACLHTDIHTRAPHVQNQTCTRITYTAWVVKGRGNYCFKYFVLCTGHREASVLTLRTAGFTQDPSLPHVLGADFLAFMKSCHLHSLLVCFSLWCVC